jgi:hypothetical protein
VQSVAANTVGHYTLTLAPPAGAPGPVLHGQLDITVESKTHRRG